MEPEAVEGEIIETTWWTCEECGVQTPVEGISMPDGWDVVEGVYGELYFACWRCLEW